MTLLRRALFLVVPLLILIFGYTAPVYAATIVVNSTQDYGSSDPDPDPPNDGDCTLREAIVNANGVSGNYQTYTDCQPGSVGLDTIQLSNNVTIAAPPDDDEFFLTEDLTIESTASGNVEIDAGGNTTIFVVQGGLTLTLDGITLLNSDGPAVLINNGSFVGVDCVFRDGTANNGAGINAGGTGNNVTLTNCVFDNNDVTGEGGAIYKSTNGALTITNTVFFGNDADERGGAIRTGGVATIVSSYFSGNTAAGDATNEGGGAIYTVSNSQLTITANVFSGNSADGTDGRGGAIHMSGGNDAALFVNYSHFGTGVVTPLPGALADAANYFSFVGPNTTTGTDSIGGAIYTDSPIAVVGSSFVGNTSSSHGGAIASRNRPSGTFIASSFIANSTFEGNTATGNGGAIYQFTESGAGIAREMDIINTTIANNSAAQGGGLMISEVTGIDARLDVSNTLLDNNTGGNCAAIESDGDLEFIDSGNNLSFNGACTLLTTISSNPNLQALSLEFSLPNILTFIMPLGNDSAASGAGNQTICGNAPILNVDQRNIPATRPDPTGSNCDIGSYESDQAPEINVTGSGLNIADGDATPELGDHTQFMPTTTGSPVSRTFTIQNLGTSSLALSLPVTVPSGFTVTSAPSATIASGGNTTFTVQCDASTDGTFTGDISIDNNDGDENPYNYAISCQVDPLVPDINVEGNAVTIVNGDNTPDSADHTQFMPTTTGSPVSRTFTIENTGNTTLNVNTTVTVPTGFTVTSTPSATVASSGNTPFTVECDATTDGTFTGTVSISSDDPDENPYTFDISCQVDPLVPDINVEGNAVTIVNGDNTPDSADHTQFMTTTTGSPVSRTFTIENTGNTTLNVNTTVTVPTGFTVTSAPSATVASSGNTPFTVECDATTDGTFTGTVSISSDDPDENPYTFDISCQVDPLVPDINVEGNAVTIVNGDNTPDSADHTQFMTTTTGSPVSRTFTIENTGNTTLNVNTTVTVPTGFTVTSAPSATVASSGNTPFTVECDATTDGTFTGTVSISSDDPDENPYTFDISCQVDPLVPDINVEGNAVTIANGDNTPDSADHTQFMTTTSGSPVSRTFTIENTGNTSLNVNTTVTVPTGFTVTSAPSATVASGGNTPFTVECDATTDGTFTGTVSISSDDPDENPYTFDISCQVDATPAPEINVAGNSVNIVTGDITPDVNDHTDFGTTVVGAPITRTFTIENNGSANLTVNNITAIPTGFTVTTQPTSPVNASTSTTVDIQCDATTMGSYSGTITIDNNDADENPYTFVISCQVDAFAPNILVTGNGNAIVLGDNTPDVSDNTDFGTTPVGTAITRDFIIESNGNTDLALTLPVSVPTGFSVSTSPTTPLASGTNTILTVDCDAASPGNYSGTLSITSDDPDDSPYTFDISCQVNAIAPDINVTGNGVNIVNGDTTPDSTDDTDFGSTGVGTPVSRTFTIENLGNIDLNLTLPISVSAGFTVTTPPTTPVGTSGSTTFIVQCDAASISVFNATVSITSDDPDENPYTFDITCNVTAGPEPEINLVGNGLSIVSGDNTPDLNDNTDFGSTPVTAPISRSFTIENIGSADLTGIGVITPAGFTLTSSPATTVSAGNNTSFTVECAAATQGTYSGTVSIANNDSDENPYTFDIACDVIVAPLYASSPYNSGDTIAFGNVLVGNTVTRNLTISEVGTANLILTSANLSGAGFSIISTTPALPTTIVDNSANTVIVELACTPTSTGTINGSLEVVHNATGSPTTYPLICIGTNAGGNPSSSNDPQSGTAPEINVFDPAISKIGFLVPGQVGVTGEKLEWIVTVSNTGNAIGNNVTVTDTLLDALQIDSVNAPNASVTINGQTVSVTYPTLQIGETAQFSIFTTVLEGVSVNNTACVNASNQETEECATSQPIRQLPSTGETPAIPPMVAILTGLITALVGLTIWRKRMMNV